MSEELPNVESRADIGKEKVVLPEHQTHIADKEAQPLVISSIEEKLSKLKDSNDETLKADLVQMKEFIEGLNKEEADQRGLSLSGLAASRIEGFQKQLEDRTLNPQIRTQIESQLSIAKYSANYLSSFRENIDNEQLKARAALGVDASDEMRALSDRSVASKFVEAHNERVRQSGDFQGAGLDQNAIDAAKAQIAGFTSRH